MKLVVFTNAEGNKNLVNFVISRHSVEEICVGVSLGDLYINSKESDLDKLFTTHLLNRDKSFANLFNNTQFDYIVYHVFGCKDDIFAESDKDFYHYGLKCFFNEVTPFLTKSGSLKVGFLGGYFNNQEFDKYNFYRLQQQRIKKSTMLCKKDFQIFTEYNKIDYLFSHESPFNYPLPKRGCHFISNLIEVHKIKRCFYGHHNFFSFTEPISDCPIIGLPSLRDGYLTLDLETDEVIPYVYYKNEYMSFEDFKIIIHK